MKKLTLLTFLVVFFMPIQAQLVHIKNISPKGRPVSFYVRGSYVAAHESALPAVLGFLEDDNVVAAPGAVVLAGFRTPFKGGWYGGMELGLYGSQQRYQYKEIDYSTILDDEIKYYYYDDLFSKFGLQITPLLVGYRYDILRDVSVDLHTGLCMRFCPFSWRSTTSTYEGNAIKIAGSLGWDSYDHYSECLQYGFGLTFFKHYNVDLTARGLHALSVSVGYEF